MSYSLPLPDPLKTAGWKIKIRNFERNEDPHITFIRRTTCYRWNLRTQAFMDPIPDPGDVPRELLEYAKANLGLLCSQWNILYPENPV